MIHQNDTLMHKVTTNASKIAIGSAVAGGTAAVVSYAVLGRTEPIEFFGVSVPEYALDGFLVGVDHSVAQVSGMYVVPYLEAKATGNPSEMFKAFMEATTPITTGALFSGSKAYMGYSSNQEIAYNMMLGAGSGLVGEKVSTLMGHVIV